MVYSYYDYLETYYEDYYDHYYEYYYWPYYYGVITVSNETYICSNSTNSTVSNETLTTTLESGTIMHNGTLCHIFNSTFPPSPYEYKSVHNLDYITPPLFTLSVGCAIIAMVIASIFFQKLYQSKKDKRKFMVTLITSFAMICHLGYAIVDPMMYYFWWIGYNVKVAVRTEIAWEIWWLSTKLSLYAVYIYRYYMIFNGARFVSRMQKIIIFGGFVLVMFIQMVIFALYIVSYVDFLYDWEDMNARRTYLNMAWTFLVIDFIFIFTICFLLNRAILQIVIGTEKSTESKLASYVADDPNSKSDPHSLHSIQSLPSIGSGSKSEITVKQEKEMVKKAKRKRSVHLRQNDLMHATTKIALICMISMLSSLGVQILWLVQEEIDHGILYWISYIWPLDNVINMLCIHLLLGVAKDHYKFICSKICKCHQCCLFWMVKIVNIQTKQKHAELLLTYQNSYFSESSGDRRKSRDKSRSNEDTIDTEKLEAQKSCEDTVNVTEVKVTKMEVQTSNESVVVTPEGMGTNVQMSVPKTCEAEKDGQKSDNNV